MRTHAREWLEMAEKVYHYRRDRLMESELEELQTQIQEVRRLVKNRAERMKLKLGVESLEETLRRLGGMHYPKSSIVENVEFFLVAAIVILGFRAYFIQPFKIPTNSMWPSYYGMTGEVFAKPDDAPGYAARAFRLLAFGAQRRVAESPSDGAVSADFFENGEMAFTVKKGRHWLVLTTVVREYTFYVGGAPTSISVPVDFRDVDKMLREVYFGGEAEFAAYVRKITRNGTELTQSVMVVDENTRAKKRVVRIPLNRSVEKGDSVLEFDVLTGDQLFVDRVSYHFVKPSVGQGFVFRTGQIDSPYMRDRDTKRQIDEYYVKRLVGTPGDTLEIKDYTLFRNGKPITGTDAFDKNAQREDDYVGYRNTHDLEIGETMTVPTDQYMALGDNSADSQDSRYWGFISAKEVIGRPIFIYYPFTKRWGPKR